MFCPYVMMNPQEQHLHENEPENVKYFSAFDLKIIGILLCQGSGDEKALELYYLCQNINEMIAWTDKELKRAFFKILDLSTELTFNFEPNFTGKLKPEALSEANIQIIKSK